MFWEMLMQVGEKVLTSTWARRPTSASETGGRRSGQETNVGGRFPLVEASSKIRPTVSDAKEYAVAQWTGPDIHYQTIRLSAWLCSSTYYAQAVREGTHSVVRRFPPQLQSLNFKGHFKSSRLDTMAAFGELRVQKNSQRFSRIHLPGHARDITGLCAV